MRPICVLALSLLTLVTLTAPVGAQETWGSVRGTVTDQSGAVVPGAAVELSGGALPAAVRGETDPMGVFRFARTPPATGYRLLVTAPGFRAARAAELQVDLGKTTAVEIRLELGRAADSIAVAGDAVVLDAESSSSAVTVDRSFFERLPAPRSFYDLISLAPGARNETKTAGFQIDGASGSENVFYLDGQDVSAVQTGVLSNQNRIPVEMVQQIEIKNGLMEAQYGGAMGGVVNAVLRSGSNDLHGQAGFYFDNDAMMARPRPSLTLNPFDDTKPLYVQNSGDAYREWVPILRLGGPLIRNKAFFSSSYVPTRLETERAVRFTDGVVGSFRQRDMQQYLANKVDAQPFSRLRLNGTWIWSPDRVTGQLPSYAGTDASSNPWSQLGSRTSNNVARGQADYLASNKLVVSFRAGHSFTNLNTNYGIPAAPALYYQNSNIGAPGIPESAQHAAGWLSQSNQVVPYDTHVRNSFAADVSYIGGWRGQHELKGGWQRNNLSNDVYNNTYPGGYYRFYWNSSYRCAASCAGKLSGPYGYYRYRIAAILGDASSDNQALFVQDSWKIHPRLTLNLGLRTEREFVPSYSSGSSSPSPAITFGWQQKLSPRIGAAWDVTGKGRQKLYASWGMFYDMMKYQLPRGSFGGENWKDYFFGIDDPNIAATLAAKGYVPPSAATRLPGTFFEMIDWRIPSNDPAHNLIDPNLKPMQQRMFDFGYEHMIAETLVASARFTDRRLVRVIEDTGTMTPEGEQYYIANPGEGITSGADWTSRWGAGIPFPPKPVRQYDALELRLDKRFSERLQFAFSYTISRLYGNYSGLTSSDENGRTSPNLNRYYDEPWVGVMQNGQYAMGRLATDRPHSLKLFGAYTLKSRVGRTTFAPNLSAYSGTPITTELPLITTTPAFPFGRGDLGRTPFFSNTDVNVQHEIAPLSSRENLKVLLELTIFNLFNSATATDRYKTIAHQNDVGTTGLSFPIYADIFKGFDTAALMQAQGVRVDPEYGLPTAFQPPRQLRFQMSFQF